MCDHIKSRDLCERCAWGWSEKSRCSERKTCVGCDNIVKEDGVFCRCSEVKRGTPCPYFEENEDMA